MLGYFGKWIIASPLHFDGYQRTHFFFLFRGVFALSFESRVVKVKAIIAPAIADSIKSLERTFEQKLGTRLTGLRWLSGNMKTVNYGPTLRHRYAAYFPAACSTTELDNPLVSRATFPPSGHLRRLLQLIDCAHNFHRAPFTKLHLHFQLRAVKGRAKEDDVSSSYVRR